MTRRKIMLGSIIRFSIALFAARLMLIDGLWKLLKLHDGGKDGPQ